MFEGDVLKISSPNPNYNYLTVIHWELCTLCVGITEQGSNTCAIGFAESVWNEYECTVEVIGNVYDNPELGCPMPNRNE